MAWYSSWTRAQQLAITVPAATVAPLPYFPVVLTAASLPTELTNNTYGRSDGGDLAFAADLGVGNSVSSIGAQIPCEVVSAVFGVTPSAEIHVQVPSVAATGTLTYIWVLYGNSGQTAQPAAGTTYGSQKVWNENGTQNFAGVYHLNEAGTNPTTYDSTSNTANSTSQTWTPTAGGQFGRGGSFNGSQTIALPTSSFPANNNFTVSLWANQPTGLGYESAWADTSTYRTLGTSSGNSFAQTSGGAKTCTGASITIGMHHLAMVKSSTAGLILYTDSVATTNSTATGNSAVGAAHSIGSQPPNLLYFNGTIDEVRLASAVRSASWIAAEYANQSAPGTFIAASGSALSTISTTFSAVSLLLGF